MAFNGLATRCTSDWLTIFWRAGLGGGINTNPAAGAANRDDVPVPLLP